MQVVWFKRDLRLEDNEALTLASCEGRVLPLYILEPELWQQPDMSHRHYRFLCDSLAELDRSLNKLGHQLVVRVGDAVEVLEALRSSEPSMALWSHQETWNGWTYKRDQRVKQWVGANGIAWHELRQHGVVRRLGNRNGWAAGWYKTMKQPTLPVPALGTVQGIESQLLPAASEFGLTDDLGTEIQKGGRSEGLKLLKTFLNERGEHYTQEMSSPVTGYDSCSRISAHLAFGTLSMREVFHAAEQRAAELKALPTKTRGKWPSAMRSFSGRLRWHCHFMQKLEDEPRIEFENMHPAYDGLREKDFDVRLFKAWQEGKTGYPMVDACMRALTATGWLNFRMRAMLMSFASYHLWLHWRETSLHLARLFTDYEPGIHYSQAQMQSGTTGINSIRIYNPIKQSKDHDPEGVFIRRWIPELRALGNDEIHTPWETDADLNGYPLPIVDEKEARKAAASRLYGLRKNKEHKAVAKEIVNKHGSRKSGIPNHRSRKPKNPAQGELPL